MVYMLTKRLKRSNFINYYCNDYQIRRLLVICQTLDNEVCEFGNWLLLVFLYRPLNSSFSGVIQKMSFVYYSN